LPELLGIPRGRLGLNAWSRCLRETMPHKSAMAAPRVTRGRDWLAFATDLRLDDLTSTSFEGRLAGKPKAQQGYARDHGPGGQQLGLGLVVNRDGFPRGFEALAGHTRDAATLTPLLTALEQRGGGARRVGGFDRGMATEDQLRHGRQSQRVYVAAVRRAVTRPYLEAIRRGPWRCLGAAGPDEPTLEVQLWPTRNATASANGGGCAAARAATSRNGQWSRRA